MGERGSVREREREGPLYFPCTFSRRRAGGTLTAGPASGSVAGKVEHADRELLASLITVEF